MYKKQEIIDGYKSIYPTLLPCLKSAVYVLLVTVDGQKFYGMNHITTVGLIECPRKDFPTGQGYELCKSVCKQQAHAEVNVIHNALLAHVDVRDATMYLTGHYYCCEDCCRFMYDNGVKSIYCIDSDKEYVF